MRTQFWNSLSLSFGSKLLNISEVFVFSSYHLLWDISSKTKPIDALFEFWSHKPWFSAGSGGCRYRIMARLLCYPLPNFLKLEGRKREECIWIFSSSLSSSSLLSVLHCLSLGTLSHIPYQKKPLQYTTSSKINFLLEEYYHHCARKKPSQKVKYKPYVWTKSTF